MTLDPNAPSVHLTFKTTQHQAAAIERLANLWGCSRSDAIRYALSLATDMAVLGAANATPGVDPLTGNPFDAGMTQ